MTNPQVTIVVVSREHFNCTCDFLESLYNNTNLPFKLVYIDSGSPPKIRRYLESQAQIRGFHLIRTDCYLFPNQARNLGLRQVNSKYVLFINNDVIVSPGWLHQLIQTAEDTGASVVGPLICVGIEQQTIHLAGGEAHIVLEIDGDRYKRRIHEKRYFDNEQVADVQAQLRRQKCELIEFHCMLVRSDIFQQIGLLDEAILLHKWEQIDFCLAVIYAGKTIYCEPTVAVTYIPKPPFILSDIAHSIPYWNEKWEFSSLNHFYQKWDLANQENDSLQKIEGSGMQTLQRLLVSFMRQWVLEKSRSYLNQL